MKHNGETLGPKVYGFWRYDRFPFILGAPGRVIQKVDKGNYRMGNFVADGYGGAAFKDPVTMPLKEGKAIAHRLELLKKDHDEVMASLETHYKTMVDQILKLPARKT